LKAEVVQITKMLVVAGVRHRRFCHCIYLLKKTQ
jgi:hypothetical protein